jgi:hypothetical protein
MGVSAIHGACKTVLAKMAVITMGRVLKTASASAIVLSPETFARIGVPI